MKIAVLFAFLAFATHACPLTPTINDTESKPVILEPKDYDNLCSYSYSIKCKTAVDDVAPIDFSPNMSENYFMISRIEEKLFPNQGGYSAGERKSFFRI